MTFGQPHYYCYPASELPKLSPLPITIVPNLEDLYQHFARSLADEVLENNRAGRPTRIIWPVGPVGQYPLLIDICNRERISWQAVHIFNMDDYLDWQGQPLPVEHPLSFEGFIRRQFIDRLAPDLRPPEDHLHFPTPLCLEKYSADIQTVGGIDTCYAGIAVHGHIAFNEPAISRYYKISLDQMRNSRTRILPMAPESFIMNGIRSAGGDLESMPPMCVTVGMKDILTSRRIRVYLQGGRWQQAVLRRVLFGEVSVEYPGTFIREHSDVHIYTTEETAQPPVLDIRA
jgi:glucosamine-6-phosphate deaminase